MHFRSLLFALVDSAAALAVDDNQIPLSGGLGTAASTESPAKYRLRF